MTSIRPATPEDADEIDRVHVQSWLRGYGDFLSPEDMIGARIPPEERVAAWRERVSDRAISTWVYEVEGFIAGFASAGEGQLTALYVDPAAQGAGVGTALLEHAEHALRDAGATEATLEVFARNEHGRRFYEARGWEFVRDEPPRWVAPSVTYRKPL
jgi:ribosomal protein S18 acetylase RimI-like enzyme